MAFLSDARLSLWTFLKSRQLGLENHRTPARTQALALQLSSWSVWWAEMDATS